MKRIKEFKKMFGVEGALELKQLKKQYRNLVKEWHPDKFPDGGEKAEEAEAMSRKVIEGYHFLVSMAPETLEAQKEEYTELTTNSGIQDLQHKGLLLEVTFLNGDTYEYFGMNAQLFNKFLNAYNQYRFAKRKVFNAFPYRKAKSGTTDVGDTPEETGA
jgi:DnaJ-class molecular chaperone